jgi:hypothetical protein
LCGFLDWSHLTCGVIRDVFFSSLSSWCHWFHVVEWNCHLQSQQFLYNFVEMKFDKFLILTILLIICFCIHILCGNWNTKREAWIICKLTHTWLVRLFIVVTVCDVVVHFHGVALLVGLVAMVFVSCSTCLLRKVLAMALLCCREERYTDERAKVRGEAGRSFELIGCPRVVGGIMLSYQM